MTIENTQTEEETKECPFCAEIIKKAAVLCRYCRSNLPIDDTNDPAPAEQPTIEVSIANSSQNSKEPTGNLGDITKPSGEKKDFLAPIKKFFGELLGLIVILIACAFGRAMGAAMGLSFFMYVAMYGAFYAIGHCSASWYVRKRSPNIILVKIVYLSNLVTWFIPFLGLITGAATLVFAKQAKKAQGLLKTLAVVCIVASVINGIIGSGQSIARQYNDAGYKLSEQKKYKEAIEKFDEAIKVCPGCAAAFGNRGYAHYMLDQNDQSLADYSQCIQLDPNNGVTYSNRAMLYSDLKQYEKAVSDYDHAIKIGPPAASDYSGRGTANFNRGDYQQAVNDYSEAIKLQPGDHSLHYWKGLSNAALKRYQEAIADYDEAIRLDPKNAKVYASRCTTYFKLGKRELARKDFMTAKSLGYEFKK